MIVNNVGKASFVILMVIVAPLADKSQLLPSTSCRRSKQAAQASASVTVSVSSEIDLSKLYSMSGATTPVAMFHLGDN